MQPVDLMRTMARSAVVTALLGGFVLSSAAQTSIASAPVNPSASSQSDAAAQSTAEPAITDDSTSVPSVASVPIRTLGLGTLVQRTPGAIKIGPLRLATIDVNEFYESSDMFASRNTSLLGSALQANFYFDRMIKRTRLTFQYQPQLTVIDGKLDSNLADHNISVDFVQMLTSRLSMHIGDTFSYAGGRNRILGGGLVFDPTTSFAAQSEFFQHSNHWRSNYTSVSFDYALSLRNHLHVSPIVGMSYIASDQSENWGRSVGVSVSFDRDLSPRKNVGVYYSIQKNLFERTYSNTLYNTYGISYRQAFGRGWSVHAQAGAASAYFNSRTRWIPQPSASLIKGFRNSSFAISYARSTMLTTHLYNGFADQVDFGYQSVLARRFMVGVGGGIYAEVWSPQKNAGKYGRTSVGYRLLPGLNWFASFVFRRQGGDPTQVLVGDRSFVSTGFQWSPAARLSQ